MEVGRPWTSTESPLCRENKSWPAAVITNRAPRSQARPGVRQAGSGAGWRAPAADRARRGAWGSAAPPRRGRRAPAGLTPGGTVGSAAPDPPSPPRCRSPEPRDYSGPLQPPGPHPFASSPSSPSIAPPPPARPDSRGSARRHPAPAAAARPHLPPANIPGAHWPAPGAGLRRGGPSWAPLPRPPGRRRLRPPPAACVRAVVRGNPTASAAFRGPTAPLFCPTPPPSLLRLPHTGSEPRGLPVAGPAAAVQLCLLGRPAQRAKPASRPAAGPRRGLPHAPGLTLFGHRT